MTVDIFEPAPIYTVQNTGPYQVPHPYAAGTIRAAVILGGRVENLDPADMTITPATAGAEGNIFLAPAIAAQFHGARLTIWRETPEEQGWLSVLGEREKGLETQLDRIVMAMQEQREIGRRSIRAPWPIQPFEPVNGRTIIFEDGSPVPGPSASEIAGAGAAASASIAAAERSVQARDRSEHAAALAAEYAASTTGTPQFSSRALAEAAMVPAYANTIMVAGQIYRQDPAGMDLVTFGGMRWRRVRLEEQFPSDFTRTTDPEVLRAALGLEAVRDNSIVNGTHILDATMFEPSMTVYSGNGTYSHLVDVSPAVMGRTYRIYNAGSFGDLVTLDCGEELSFVGAGAHPAVTTRKQVTIEAAMVATICRASIDKVWVRLEGSYWAQPNANTTCRLMPDGTYDVRYLRAGSIAATTEANDIALPEWLSLNSAVVQAVTYQPASSGALPGAAIPLVITKMGVPNGLEAHQAAIYNPNGSAVNRPVVIHFSNVMRA